MFDKDKIRYYGDNVNGISGPRCDKKEGTPFVGGYECVNCKHCYGITKRVWSTTDRITNLTWKNGQYDGIVYCAANNNYFIRKIKNHIFNLSNRKMHVKSLDNERN